MAEVSAERPIFSDYSPPRTSENTSSRTLGE
jgi:hypothetical protein